MQHDLTNKFHNYDIDPKARANWHLPHGSQGRVMRNWHLPHASQGIRTGSEPIIFYRVRL